VNAVRKYRWKIQISHTVADQGHPVLEHLSSRTFELETLDPPPEDGQAFTLLLDDYRDSRSSPSERCVEVEVIRRRMMMEYSNGRANEPQWYVLLYARIKGSIDLPW
jgi:hypothetical protein